MIFLIHSINIEESMVYQESAFKKELDEIERIVFTEIKSFAYDSATDDGASLGESHKEGSIF